MHAAGACLDPVTSPALPPLLRPAHAAAEWHHAALIEAVYHPPRDDVRTLAPVDLDPLLQEGPMSTNDHIHPQTMPDPASLRASTGVSADACRTPAWHGGACDVDTAGRDSALPATGRAARGEGLRTLQA